MNFDEEVDLALCINLASRPDRRVRCGNLFERIALDVSFIDAIGSDDLAHESSYFSSPSRYACLVSHVKALYYAIDNCSKSVLILEDDVDINPFFRDILQRSVVPEEWKVLFLGGKHRKKPKQIDRFVYKLNWTSDNHAYIVKRPYLKQVIRAMSNPWVLEDHRYLLGRSCPNKDVLFARMQRNGGIYGICPNIAWQIENFSNNTGRFGGNYHSNGQQAVCGEFKGV